MHVYTYVSSDLPYSTHNGRFLFPHCYARALGISCNSNSIVITYAFRRKGGTIKLMMYQPMYDWSKWGHKYSNMNGMSLKEKKTKAGKT